MPIRRKILYNQSINQSIFPLKNVGCDGKMNSSAEEDECGICNGDGSQCKRVMGRFHKKFDASK